MMTARKTQLAGLAAVLAFSLTGCGVVAADDPEASPTPSSAAPVNPRDALLDGIPDDQAGAYRYEIKGGETPIAGVLDASKKAVEVKVVQSEPSLDLAMTMTIRMIDERSWIKIVFEPANLPGLPKLPKKWLLLDPSKADKDISGYDGSTDPGYAEELVKASAGLKQTGPGHFTGTTDLTRSTEAEIVDDKTLKALGTKAKAVPFTAVLDAEGHLTTLTVKIPAAGKTKAQTYAVHYSGFGTTTSPAVPAAGDQQKAPADVYDLLKG